MPATSLELTLSDEPATISFAHHVTSWVKKGDLILLNGDLGTGKTTFARALIRNLMTDESLEVPSPTFLLVLPYTGGDITILHADLYRLSDPDELIELGLEDDPDHIVLIEWPDRDPELAGRAQLIMDFAHLPKDAGRKVTLICQTSLERKDELENVLREFVDE